MACSAYRWTPEMISKIVPALQAGGSIMAAARSLNVGENALRSVIRANGIDHRSICGSGAPVPAPIPVSAPRVDGLSEAPAWQSYSPRKGWTPPEPVQPTKPDPVAVERVVCIADVHAPHHDKRAWACALSLLRELQPDRVMLMGDIMEVESVSKHPRSRPDVVRLAEEFYATNLLLDEAQDCAPDARWFYIEGNHENRAQKWANEFGVLDGLMTVPEQLYLAPRGDYHRETDNLRGMEWVGLGRQFYVINGVGYGHGVFETVNHAMSHAVALAPVVGVKHLLYAHMHSLQSATSASGHTATCCGWLGDMGAHTIRAYVRGKPRPWSHAIVYQEIDGDLVTTTPIPIVTGRAIWQGARFVA